MQESSFFFFNSRCVLSYLNEKDLKKWNAKLQMFSLFWILSFLIPSPLQRSIWTSSCVYLLTEEEEYLYYVNTKQFPHVTYLVSRIPLLSHAYTCVIHDKYMMCQLSTYLKKGL